MISKRKQKEIRRKKIVATFLIILSILITLAVATLLFIQKENIQKIDKQTNCPIDGSPEYISIIFDKSDSFNSIQQKFLKRFFSNLKHNMKEGTYLSIYSVKENVSEIIEPSFVICSPRTGENANALYENPEKIKRKWKEKFEEPLSQQISSYMTPSEANSSPIMEMLQVVALSLPLESDNRQKKIIVISDMLQNTKGWSHYRGQFNIEKLKKTSYYKKIMTNLKNTQVTILLVRRKKYESLQTKKLAYFWDNYIKLMNGQMISIEQIDG